MKLECNPVPLINEKFARLGKAKTFMKLDMRQAFRRARMHSKFGELTKFHTRFGTYIFKVLPFSLFNGPATYQRYMNDILLNYLDEFYRRI